MATTTAGKFVLHTRTVWRVALALPYARRGTHDDNRIRGKGQGVPQVRCQEIWQTQLLRFWWCLVQELR